MEPSLSQFVSVCPCLKESYTCLREQNQFPTDSKGPRVLHDSYLLLCGEGQRHRGRGRMDGGVGGWSDIQCSLSESAVTAWWVGKQTGMKGWNRCGKQRCRKQGERRWGCWRKGLKARDNIKRLWETDGEIKRERQRTSAEKRGQRLTVREGGFLGRETVGEGTSPSAWCFQNITWRLPCVGNYCRLTIFPQNRSEKICLQFLKCVPGFC